MHTTPLSGVKLHFVVACMGRLEQIKQTINSAISQPDTDYTLVDYSCPDKTGDWVAANHPQARIVRVESRTHWHASEARNIGAAAVKDGWICFLDADILLQPDFSRDILSLVKPGTFLAPIPKGGISGMIVCAKEDFDRCGGYDENITGWGWEDIDARMNLGRAGIEWRELPERLISHIDHDDALRSSRCVTADKMASNKINMLYGLIKEYLARNDEPHDPETLHALYRYCRERFLAGYPWLSWPDPEKPMPPVNPSIKYADLPFKAFGNVYRTLAGVARGYAGIAAEDWGGVHVFRIERTGLPPVLEVLSEYNRHKIAVRVGDRAVLTVMSIHGATYSVPIVGGLATLELTAEPVFLLDEAELVKDVAVAVAPAAGPALTVGLTPAKGFSGTVEVLVAIGGQPGTRQAAVLDGAEANLIFPATLTDSAKPREVIVAVSGDCQPQEIVRRTTFLAAPHVTEEEAAGLDCPARIAAFTVAGREDWVDVRPDSYGGPNDLSVDIAFGWTGTALVCWLTRQDDVWVDGDWLGDGVQIGVDALNSKSYSVSGDEFTLCWDNAACWVMLDRAGAGLAAYPTITLTDLFEMDQVGSCRRMVVRLPFETIGIMPEPGRKIGLAMLFSDNDGDGRKGWLEWGGGIGPAKNPREYNEITLTL